MFSSLSIYEKNQGDRSEKNQFHLLIFIPLMQRWMCPRARQLNHYTPWALKGGSNVCKLIRMDLSSDGEFENLNFKFSESEEGLGKLG